MRLVSSTKRIELSRDFDASTKMRLWSLFAAEHEKYVSLRSGSIGRGSYLKFTAETISTFQHSDSGAEFYDPTSEDNALDLAAITSKTLYNFLRRDQLGILKSHPRTFRFVEAFLAAKNRGSGHSYRRETFLETLGVSTSIQYASPKRKYPEEWLKNVGSKRGVYLFRAPTSMVPGPLQARVILIHIQKIPSETFFLFRIVPLPFELEHSRFAKQGDNLSDWSEEHFVGIGIPTRDGLSCHLTSANAKIPLYLLIRPKNENDVEFGFVSYDAPGYLLPYMDAEFTQRLDIVHYFDNQPWIV